MTELRVSQQEEDLVRHAIVKVGVAILILGPHAKLGLPVTPENAEQLAHDLGDVILDLRGLLPDDALASRKAPEPPGLTLVHSERSTA